MLPFARGGWYDVRVDEPEVALFFLTLLALYAGWQGYKWMGEKRTKKDEN